MNMTYFILNDFHSNKTWHKDNLVMDRFGGSYSVWLHMYKTLQTTCEHPFFFCFVRFTPKAAQDCWHFKVNIYDVLPSHQCTMQKLTSIQFFLPCKRLSTKEKQTKQRKKGQPLPAKKCRLKVGKSIVKNIEFKIYI